MKNEMELLAPAGSYEGLVAAINAGADAVYIGGKKFGARAYADNPEEDMLVAGIRYAHLHGKKVYMTINTLLKEKELQDELYDYVKGYYEAGLDAVIVQDFGVLSFLKKYFPDLPIHASTQMTITGVEGAKFLENQGVKRVVLARELSLEEVKHICGNVSVEIECFVHGAICYCYSGQCLFSSFLGGRSGNRGRCAQPCRLPYQTYKGKKVISSPKALYPLSLKDMMTLEYLPELIQAGITSFKIEGRMKRPEYAAGVVEIYRKYIDLYQKNPENFQIDSKDKERLLQLYSRSGNSTGYYKQHNGRNMITLENPAYISGEDELFQGLKEKYTNNIKKHNISGILRVFKGKALELDVKLNNITVSVSGAVVEQAKNQPLGKERIEKQMQKTGGTCFQFEYLEIQMDSDIFVPLQAMNEIRRKALEELEKAVLKPYERQAPENFLKADGRNTKKECERKSQQPVLHVSVETEEQLESLLAVDEIQEIYIDAGMFPLKDWKWYLQKLGDSIEKIKQAGKKGYYYMPAIFRTETEQKFSEHGKELLALPMDGMVVRNLESLVWLKKQEYTGKIISDYNLYTFNHEAENFLKEKGIEVTTLPLELNEYELKEVSTGGEILIVYGHIPFMVSAQCVNKTISGCDKENGKLLTLKDRYKKDFYVKNYCDYCYNIIRNGVPLSLLGVQKSINNINPSGIRLMFSKENGREAYEIAKAFANQNTAKEEVLFMEFTRGHLKKGVE